MASCLPNTQPVLDALGKVADAANELNAAIANVNTEQAAVAPESVVATEAPKAPEADTNAGNEETQNQQGEGLPAYANDAGAAAEPADANVAANAAAANAAADNAADNAGDNASTPAADANAAEPAAAPEAAAPEAAADAQAAEPAIAAARDNTSGAGGKENPIQQIEEEDESEFVQNNKRTPFKTVSGRFIFLNQIIDMLKNEKCKLSPEKCNEALQKIIKANNIKEINDVIKTFKLYPNTIQSAGTRKPRMQRRKKTQRKRSKTIRKIKNRT